jgi:hypothetical protein
MIRDKSTNMKIYSRILAQSAHGRGYLFTEPRIQARNRYIVYLHTVYLHKELFVCVLEFTGFKDYIDNLSLINPPFTCMIVTFTQELSPVPDCRVGHSHTRYYIS